MGKKPIRVFYSTLSSRFYATNKYKSEIINNMEKIIITGEKYDVTQDIARVINKYQIEFTVQEEPNDDTTD